MDCKPQFTVKQMQKIIRHFPKFSDRQVWANSVDPDQTAPRSGSTLFAIPCTFWTHYSMVEPPCSNLRGITANFSGVRNFRSFTVCQEDAEGMANSVDHLLCTVCLDLSVL